MKKIKVNIDRKEVIEVVKSVKNLVVISSTFTAVSYFIKGDIKKGLCYTGVAIVGSALDSIHIEEIK